MAKFPLSKGGWPTLGRHPHTFTYTSTYFLINIFFVQKVQGATCPCHTVWAIRCTVTR